MATATPTELTGYITASFDFFGRRYDVFEAAGNNWIVLLPKQILYRYRARLKLTGYRTGERQLIVRKVECVDSL